MRKAWAPVALPILIASALSCSNWNRMTPKPLDNTAIEEEVRKNMAGDGITGMHIDVKNGVVTLSGDAKSVAQRDQAIHDASRVKGVSMVVNRITIKS